MLTLFVVYILFCEAAGATRYVGCFDDPNVQDLPGLTISDKTVKKCIDLCMSVDYRASTCRRGCYCGESLGQGPLPEGRCFAYCPGVPAEECVGSYTHSVWFTGEEEGSESSADSESSDVSSRQLSDVTASQTGQTVYLGNFAASYYKG